jgi:hypothetical protein
MTAAPPVGSSKTPDVLLVHVIAYFSSVSAEFNNPPVLPMCFGSVPGNTSVMLSIKSTFSLYF